MADELDRSRLLVTPQSPQPVHLSTSARPRSLAMPHSRRPNLAGLKQRLSVVFHTPDNGMRPTVPPPKGAPREEKNTDPYWRPMPFTSEVKEIRIVRNAHNLIEVVSDTALVYTTNLPALSTASTASMPERIELVAPPSADHRCVSSNAVISRLNGELVVQLHGLDPIKFYRAKPDCLFAVDCFVARRSANKAAWRTTSTNFRGAEGHGEVSIAYAWKTTSMVGKGGLKLVDLRDDEVLAYYIPCRARGKCFAKVTLQGSGLVSQRIVLATILALKYRHVKAHVAFLSDAIDTKIARSSSSLSLSSSSSSPRTTHSQRKSRDKRGLAAADVPPMPALPSSVPLACKA